MGVSLTAEDFLEGLAESLANALRDPGGRIADTPLDVGQVRPGNPGRLREFSLREPAFPTGGYVVPHESASLSVLYHTYYKALIAPMPHLIRPDRLSRHFRKRLTLLKDF